MKTDRGFVAALTKGQHPHASAPTGSTMPGLAGRDVRPRPRDAQAHHHQPSLPSDTSWPPFFENTLDRDVEGQPTADYL